MPRFRSPLPQLGDKLFLTDGGLETYLVFIEGVELPAFAAYPLLEQPHSRQILERWYRHHAQIATDHGAGFILETPTWRASRDWGARLGHDPLALARINGDSVRWLLGVAAELSTARTPMVVSGCVGPRGDGYVADLAMSAEEARSYHAAQVRSLAEAGADMICALTMTNPDEATGIANAAAEAGIPIAVSFTTETDGRLPSGHTLAEAIAQVDTEGLTPPAYFMLNCAHPTHFDPAIDGAPAWMQRIRGLRANASTMSHAELDSCETLDDGDPVDLAARYHALRARFPQLTVLGGCCGTDARHVHAIAAVCTGHAHAA